MHKVLTARPWPRCIRNILRLSRKLQTLNWKQDIIYAYRKSWSAENARRRFNQIFQHSTQCIPRRMQASEDKKFESVTQLSSTSMSNGIWEYKNCVHGFASHHSAAKYTSTTVPSDEAHVHHLHSRALNDSAEEAELAKFRACRCLRAVRIGAGIHRRARSPRQNSKFMWKRNETTILIEPARPCK